MNLFDLELAFTDTYRTHLDKSPALREAHCLRILYPALLGPIQDGDLFAGRIPRYPLVGLGTEDASGGPGYYCRAERLRQAFSENGLDPAYRRRVEDMIAFWETETTIAGRLVTMLPPDVLQGTTNAIAEMGGRLAGPLLNYAKLAQVGLPGLLREVAMHRERVVGLGGDVEIYDAMLMSLDLLAEVCRYYAAQARTQAAHADAGRRVELLDMAHVLEQIAVERPLTYREAIQLVWLYALMSFVVNYGRLDVALGDFYARDVDEGRLSEADALRLTQSLWRLMADRKIVFNSRVIVGGMGRPNEANADRFALLAMEATRTVVEIEPQLTLRFYEGMNPALMQKALDVIGEGRTYPMLYNDDVNVPAAQSAFGVSRAEAEAYLPYGCGEYALDAISIGSPNCSLSLLKALEATLHNGRDARTGELPGLALGELGDFATFDDLWEAYKRQVEHYALLLGRRHALEYVAQRESAAYLYVSMLYNHCIERGKSVVDGGARYTGGVIESFGLTNTADSLTSIKRLVYDEKRLTLDELLAALDANFVGHERVRKMLLDAPKYGNDDEDADRMVQAVSDHMSRYIQSLAPQIGLDYFLVVNINNHANVGLGKLCAASADGRRSGEPLANGNNPTAGRDTRGVTAFLNSIAKIDPGAHAGYVQNMKFSRSMFSQDRRQLRALLDTYFARGGAQAMITVVGRGDLEAALREPEKYRNLIVRVGGFSARFVELERDVQQDLLKRTLY